VIEGQVLIWPRSKKGHLDEPSQDEPGQIQRGSRRRIYRAWALGAESWPTKLKLPIRAKGGPIRRSRRALARFNQGKPKKSSSLSAATPAFCRPKRQAAESSSKTTVLSESIDLQGDGGRTMRVQRGPSNGIANRRRRWSSIRGAQPWVCLPPTVAAKFRTESRGGEGSQDRACKLGRRAGDRGGA